MFLNWKFAVVLRFVFDMVYLIPNYDLTGHDYDSMPRKFELSMSQMYILIAYEPSVELRGLSVFIYQHRKRNFEDEILKRGGEL